MADLESIVLRRLRNPAYPCLFSDSMSCRVRQALVATPSRMQSVLTRLVENLKGETEIFWEEPGRSNLLTFVYWCKGDSTKSKMVAQNGATLERFPNNVAALTMKLRLLVQQGRANEASDVRATLDKLESIENEQPVSLQVLRCEGEVAFTFHYIGPAFYGEAVDRYRKLLDRYDRIRELSSPQESEEFVTTLCSWHFYLAQTYNRMMRADLTKLNDRGFTIDELYAAMRDNLIEVLNTDNQVYKGMAMIELADAFKKCRQLLAAASDNKAEIVFPYKNIKTIDEFVRAALEEGRQVPYVLERCGRHFRQNARTEADFLYAISILDQCPTKHVAWHQKGLAYVALGMLTKNSGGSDGGQSRRGFQRGVRGSARGAQPRGADSWHGRDSSRAKSREYLMQAKQCYDEAGRLGGYAHCMYLVDLARTCAYLGQFDEAESKFADAERLIRFGSGDVNDAEVSYLYNQWGFMRSKQVANNPRLASDVTMMYRKSIRAALVAGIKYNKPLQNLRECVQRQLAENSHEIRLQLEYWILSVSVDNSSDDDDPLTGAAKNSVEVQQKIRQLMDEMVSKCRTPSLLSGEGGSAGGGRGEGDAEASLQYAHTALLYLTVLYKSNKLDMTSQGETSGVQTVVKVASYLSINEEPRVQVQRHEFDETGQQIPFCSPMRDAFRWVVGSEPMSARGFTTRSPPNALETAGFCSLEDDFDVCILTPPSLPQIQSETTTGRISKKFFETLQKYLGLNVALLGGQRSVQFDGEIEDDPREDYHWEIENAVSRSRSVVVLFVDDVEAIADSERSQSQGSWFRCVTSVLDRLCEKPTAKVCLVTSEASSSQAAGLIRDRYTDGLKKLVLPDDVNLTHSYTARLLLTSVAGLSGNF